MRTKSWVIRRSVRFMTSTAMTPSRRAPRYCKYGYWVSFHSILGLFWHCSLWQVRRWRLQGGFPGCGSGVGFKLYVLIINIHYDTMLLLLHMNFFLFYFFYTMMLLLHMNFTTLKYREEESTSWRKAPRSFILVQCQKRPSTVSKET